MTTSVVLIQHNLPTFLWALGIKYCKLGKRVRWTEREGESTFILWWTGMSLSSGSNLGVGCIAGIKDLWVGNFPPCSSTNAKGQGCLRYAWPNMDTRGGACDYVVASGKLGLDQVWIQQRSAREICRWHCYPAAGYWTNWQIQNKYFILICTWKNKGHL